MKYIYVFAILTFVFLYLKIFWTAYRLSKKTKPSYAVISVRNMENCIEGLVKELKARLKSQSYKNNCCVTKLYIVNLGSTDSTLLLLKLLARNNMFLKILTEDEYRLARIDNENSNTI